MLLPAAMTLLGRWNWRAPDALRRWLPERDLDVEAAPAPAIERRPVPVPVR